MEKEDLSLPFSAKITQIRCELVSHLFGGYSYYINLSQVETKDDIIATVVSTLYEIFTQLNLKGLIEHLDMAHFIINESIVNIKNNPPEVLRIYEDDSDDECDHDVSKSDKVNKSDNASDVNNLNKSVNDDILTNLDNLNNLDFLTNLDILNNLNKSVNGNDNNSSNLNKPENVDDSSNASNASNASSGDDYSGLFFKEHED